MFSTQKIQRVSVYFVDQNKTFFPQVKEKLSNEEKYKMFLFSTSEAFFDHLRSAGINNTNVNLFFINIENNHDSDSEKAKLIDCIKGAKNFSPDFNIFILTNQKDVNIHNELITAGALGIIPKNDSSVLRMLNHIKGLLSEKNLEKKRKARILPIKLLLFFVILVIVAAIITWLLHPEVFYN